MKSSESSVLAGFMILVVLGALGWLSSPLDENDRPLLLLPDVKAVEDYRRQAIDWAARLRLLDGELATLLSANSGDLLRQSRSAQNTFEDCLALAQEVDFMAAPPALVGLRETLANTSLSYLDAARGVLRWVSTPDQDFRDQAALLIQAAGQNLRELEANTWIHVP